MPISRKKKCSTPNTPDTTEGQSAPPLPDQQTFRKYLRNLARGVTQIDLIVTEGHEGLLAVVQALFSATLRQRCLLHKQRNVLNAVPRRMRPYGSTWPHDDVSWLT